MRKFVPLLLLIVLLGVAAYLVLQPPAPDGLRHSSPDESVLATELFASFYQDEAAANEQYLNKVLMVTGTVSDFRRRGAQASIVELESGSSTGSVVAYIDPDSERTRQEFHRGETVELKCLCTDFYENVKLTNCVEL